MKRTQIVAVSIQMPSVMFQTSLARNPGTGKSSAERSGHETRNLGRGSWVLGATITVPSREGDFFDRIPRLVCPLDWNSVLGNSLICPTPTVVIEQGTGRATSSTPADSSKWYHRHKYVHQVNPISICMEKKSQ